jgi:pyrroloquinoline quinone biosynthesis protein E
MDNAVLNFSGELFPARKEHFRLQPLSNFIKVLDFHDGSTRVISPINALILELCAGEYDINDIIKICGGVFRLSDLKAKQCVLETLEKYGAGITFHPAPLPNPLPANPLRILTSERNTAIANPLRDDYPSKITLSITYRCNHRCCFCCISAGDPMSGELEENDWLRIIDEAAELGIMEVTLSGGEPLIHPGIFSIVKRITDRGMYPIILTNGALLTEEYIKKFAQLGAGYFYLNLTAANDELYDNIVGCKGNFPWVKKAIQNLKKHGLFTRVKIVLLPFNVKEIEGILDFCYESGVDQIRIEPYRLTHISRQGKALLLSTGQLMEAEEIVNRNRARYEKRMVIDAAPFTDISWKGPADISRCGGVKSELTVLPNGDVTLCEVISNTLPDFIFGNVRQTSLNGIWFSDKPDRVYRLSADLLEEPCKSCEYLDQCKTGCIMCSLVHSRNPWSVDPRCWKANIPGNAFRN